MIAKPELVKKIRGHFNLNIYESKVWLSLLSRGIASAGEVAELSGVPRSRTYDVLESLEKRGFAMAKIGKPVKYMAVKPTVILEKLKIDTLRDADEKIKTLSKLKDTAEYEELKQLYNTTIKPIQQSEVSGAIKGKINLYSHIKQLLENAEKEIIICLPASQLLEKSRLFNGLFERLNERGVRVLIGVNCTDEDIKKVNKKYNIRAQKTDIKGKFFIADRKQTLFTLTNSIEDEMGVWFNSEFFSSSLAYLFESALRNGR